MENEIRVLIIDDNENVVRQCEEQFSKHASIAVNLKAYDGEEGLNKILNNQNDYDVVLMDLIMPKLDGIEILERMKENNVNKKVIVLTSYKKEETIKKLVIMELVIT